MTDEGRALAQDLIDEIADLLAAPGPIARSEMDRLVRRINEHLARPGNPNQGSFRMRPPPPGTHCDSHVAIDYGPHGPKLTPCPNEATVTRKSRVLPFEIWLCDDCADSMTERGKVS